MANFRRKWMYLRERFYFWGRHLYDRKSQSDWQFRNNGLRRQIAQCMDSHSEWNNFLSPDHRRRIIYFNSASETPYKKPYHFCGHEFGGEIWFGSSEGSIWKFNIDKKHLLNWEQMCYRISLLIKKFLTEKSIIISENDGFMIYNTFDASNR